MLGLLPATFPPILRELQAPSLELFDLDDEFASEKLFIY
jgi:intraflagellar transport protein 52